MSDAMSKRVLRVVSGSSDEYVKCPRALLYNTSLAFPTMAEVVYVLLIK